MAVGYTIKQARKAKGLTQKELASKCGLSSVYISQIETDKKSPTVKTLNKIGLALECYVFVEFRENLIKGDFSKYPVIRKSIQDVHHALSESVVAVYGPNAKVGDYWNVVASEEV